MAVEYNGEPVSLVCLLQEAHLTGDPMIHDRAFEKARSFFGSVRMAREMDVRVYTRLVDLGISPCLAKEGLPYDLSQMDF